MKSFPRRIVFALIATTGLLTAQAPALKRTVILTRDLSMPGREVRVAQIEIPPGVAAGLHTHPGEEVSYVLEGELELLIEGQPSLKVKAGESFMVPNGARHDARNSGAATVRLVGMYLVEKDKPLATPAR